MQRTAVTLLLFCISLNSWASTRFNQTTGKITPAVNNSVVTVVRGTKPFDTSTRTYRDNLIVVAKDNAVSLDVASQTIRTNPGTQAVVSSIVSGKEAKVDTSESLIYAELVCSASCTSNVPQLETRCIARVSGGDVPCAVAYPDATYNFSQSKYMLGRVSASTCDHTNATTEYSFETAGTSGSPTYGRQFIPVSAGANCFAAYPKKLVQYSGTAKTLVEVVDSGATSYDTLVITY
jgi:hypothetical protein